MINRIACLGFVAGWMTAGASLETFFDGGAPVVIIATVVCIACAVVLGKRD